MLYLLILIGISSGYKDRSICLVEICEACSIVDENIYINSQPGFIHDKDFGCIEDIGK